jgi:hypothetical protein
MASANNKQVFNFPQPLLTAVTDYKKLVTDYNNISDPTLKSAYKMVLTDKLTALNGMANVYASTVQTNIQALAVQ